MRTLGPWYVVSIHTTKAFQRAELICSQLITSPGIGAGVVACLFSRTQTCRQVFGKGQASRLEGLCPTRSVCSNERSNGDRAPADPRDPRLVREELRPPSAVAAGVVDVALIAPAGAEAKMPLSL
jgi:hypothetical protein